MLSKIIFVSVSGFDVDGKFVVFIIKDLFLLLFKLIFIYFEVLEIIFKFSVIIDKGVKFEFINDLFGLI